MSEAKKIEALLPCPYIDGHKFQYDYSPNKDLIDKVFNHTNEPKVHTYQDGGYWVYCSFCGARGPKFPDKETAIESWNARKPRAIDPKQISSILAREAQMTSMYPFKKDAVAGDRVYIDPSQFDDIARQIVIDYAAGLLWEETE